MRLLLREWGAVTFVVTVVLGAVVVAISLVITGSHAPPNPTLVACPTYTPYVVTPTPKTTATPHTSVSASVQATGSTSASASVSASASAAPTASATPFNPALANCPTAPLPPSSTPTPTPKPGTRTPTPTARPTQLFTPLPT